MPTVKINQDNRVVSFEAIGKALGVSETTAKNAYIEAMRKIKRALKNNPKLERELFTYLLNPRNRPVQGTLPSKLHAPDSYSDSRIGKAMVPGQSIQA